MTYGVYNRDLHSVSLEGQYSIDACKKYLWRDTDVVCSERKFRCGWVLRFTFHGWRGFHRYRYDNMIVLGFVSIDTYSNYYTWADKIVFDPKAEGGAK